MPTQENHVAPLQRDRSERSVLMWVGEEVQAVLRRGDGGLIALQPGRPLGSKLGGICGYNCLNLPT
jgi:hypothetical protein